MKNPVKVGVNWKKKLGEVCRTHCQCPCSTPLAIFLLADAEKADYESDDGGRSKKRGGATSASKKRAAQSPPPNNGKKKKR